MSEATVNITEQSGTVIVNETLSTVHVDDQTNTVTVSETTSTVSVPGESTTVVPVGIVGPQGPSGDKHYTHSQNSPATSWTITHNLLKRPSVSVVDSAGTLVHGTVEYIDSNTCRVSFSAAFSGSAYLN